MRYGPLEPARHLQHCRRWMDVLLEAAREQCTLYYATQTCELTTDLWVPRVPGHAPDAPLSLVIETVVRGQIVLGQGTPEEVALVADGTLRPVPQGARQGTRHDATGRWFIDYVSYVAYEAAYQARDVSIFLTTERASRKTPGRPPRGDEKLHDYLAQVETTARNHRTATGITPTLDQLRTAMPAPYTWKTAKTYRDWDRESLKLIGYMPLNMKHYIDHLLP